MFNPVGHFAEIVVGLFSHAMDYVETQDFSHVFIIDADTGEILYKCTAAYFDKVDAEVGRLMVDKYAH